MRRPPSPSGPILPALLAASLLFAAHIPSALAQDDTDLDGEPGLAEPPAEPFAPAPSILVGTGNLLIVRSHNNNFDVSGFTTFLASEGWVINQHLSGPVTDSVLAGHDVLMVPTRNSNDPTPPYTLAERAAIRAFLDAGHGMWVFNDITSPSGINTLAEEYGVSFQYDVVRDPSNNEGLLTWPTIHQLAAHPITSSVGSYGYYGGDCLIVSPPGEIVARADEDAYSVYCPEGTRPPVLVVFETGGRAVFAGDITPLHPNWYPDMLRPEEQLLLQNIVNWLLGRTPTATLPSSWGSVKAAYSGANVK